MTDLESLSCPPLQLSPVMDWWLRFSPILDPPVHSLKSLMLSTGTPYLVPPWVYILITKSSWELATCEPSAPKGLHNRSTKERGEKILIKEDHLSIIPNYATLRETQRKELIIFNVSTKSHLDRLLSLKEDGGRVSLKNFVKDFLKNFPGIKYPFQL